jgi:hypothetical protein
MKKNIKILFTLLIFFSVTNRVFCSEQKKLTAQETMPTLHDILEKQNRLEEKHLQKLSQDLKSQKNEIDDFITKLEPIIRSNKERLAQNMHQKPPAPVQTNVISERFNAKLNISVLSCFKVMASLLLVNFFIKLYHVE